MQNYFKEKFKLKLHLNSRGMTLVEVIVAFAIVIIASVALYSGFAANYNIINRGVANQKAGETLDSAVFLANFTGVDQATGKGDISFMLDGQYFKDKQPRNLLIYTETKALKTKDNENVEFRYFQYDNMNN